MSYHEFAYYYDQLMEDMPYPQWQQFMEACWSRWKRPSSIVDLGCGTGNLSIPLAIQGHHVTGIDLSPDMLALARQKQEQLQSTGATLHVNWVEQDMTEWTLPDKVDAVISFCDSLNYVLEEEELERTFLHTFEGLVVDGLFIFDVHTIYTLEQYACEQPFILNDDDIAYIWHCYLNKDRHEIEHELTIFAKDHNVAKLINSTEKEDYFRRIDEIHSQRAYCLDWIKQTLLKIGFRQVECFSDFSMDAPTEQTKRAFFVAQK